MSEQSERIELNCGTISKINLIIIRLIIIRKSIIIIKKKIIKRKKIIIKLKIGIIIKKKILIKRLNPNPTVILNIPIDKPNLNIMLRILRSI